MKQFSLALCLGILLTVSLFGQLPPEILEVGSPEEVGLSSDRLQRLDKLILKYVEREWLPGGVFTIARHGKLVYHKAFGQKDLDGAPYQLNDIFRIASMTKAITTVSIMQLYERGLLGLDDPVHQYIPAFKEMTVLDSFSMEDSTYTTQPIQHPITVRHLLTHTSGITYGVFNPGAIAIIYDKFDLNQMGLSHTKYSTDEAVNKIAKAPLVFQPGDRYLYGLNMEVLGRIVEVVSGMTLDKYFQDNIFDPLGMEDTHFYLPDSKHHRLTPIFTHDEGGVWSLLDASSLGDLDYPLASERRHFAGGGGLCSTAQDYATFIQVLCQGGEHKDVQLLGRKTVEVMTSDQLQLQNRTGKGISKRPGITFGLGFRLLTDEGAGWSSKSPGTYEWGGYFNTKFFIDPKEQLTFVGMTQVLPNKRPEFWDRLTAMIYAAIDDDLPALSN